MGAQLHFIFFLFFLSGASSLVYQVTWVRVFGNVFGNTVYSAAMVVAVFMLGLGAGGYGLGAWADRRYPSRPESLLRAYGSVEIAIGACGALSAWAAPHLVRIVAGVSAYVPDEHGWWVLSWPSYLARAATAILLLVPATFLMGGTLSLLARHLVRADVAQAGGLRIALLYGVNTAGAALGALLTDFALVPAYGLRAAQLVAVALNLGAGTGALWLASRGAKLPTRVRSRHLTPTGTTVTMPDSPRLVLAVALALALSGFAAMGMEILWFRHLTMMLGQFRAVFSLLLAIVLLGIGVGALLAGALLRRQVEQAAGWFMAVQASFVAAGLLGLYLADSSVLDATLMTAPALRAGLGLVGPVVQQPGAAAELWFNTRPMLIEVVLPALLMGFSFPLGSALVQRAEPAVGRRCGALYLANTLGAVAGSLATGFVLMPRLGLQTTATVLMLASAATIPLLQSASRRGRTGRPAIAASARACVGASAVAIVALGMWLTLPGDHIIARVLPSQAADVRVLALHEGVNEVITVTERPDGARTLLTNAHAMSSTLPMAQRYMRALAHVPLLSIEAPRSVLVIGFGVGNTAHAASLHPTVKRIEVADLSKDILEHAHYFRGANGDVLRDPRVAVYVNDGRQHLQMQPPETYDLVTLEPPPVGYAGVAALYSRQFYELASSRLAPTGQVSQWLPAYQVPNATTLAMVRAFIDVFPAAVLLSGAEADLLLLGAKNGRIEIDPDRLAARLADAPAVRADLARLDLGTPTQIVGMFVASAATLAAATRKVSPVTDDHPIQEYGVRSLLDFGESVPASIVDLDGLAAWCPRCFSSGRPVPVVSGLDLYLALLREAYAASPADIRLVRAAAERRGRTIAGSAYLGAIVPETARVRNALGIALAASGRLDEAIAEFRTALALDPAAARTYWHLGAALAARGALDEAVDHLRQSVTLDPANAQAHSDLGTVLAVQGRMAEAIPHFERAAALDPASAEARQRLDQARRSARFDTFKQRP